MADEGFSGEDPENPLGGLEGLASLLSSEGLNDIDRLLRTKEALRARERAERLFTELRGVAEATGKLVEKIDEKRESIEDHLEKSRRIFDPNYDKPFGELTDANGYGSLEFIRRSGAELHKQFVPIYRGLFMISELYNEFVKNPFSRGAATSGELKRLLEAIEKIIPLTLDQVKGGILNYERIVSAAYAAIQFHHKDLRRKYQGLGDEPELTAKSIFDLILGGRDTEKKGPKATGSKIGLVDDNCVLTDTLMDIIDNLPQPYEIVVPSGKNGRTKVIRKLDEYDVQNAARVLIQIANTVYMGYLRDPNLFPASIAESIQTFYSHYSEFEPLLRDVLDAVRDLEHVTFKVMGGDFDKRMPDPAPVISRLQRLNFFSIRPTSDEIQSRTKVEKDYAYARGKLLYHLRDTLNNLVEIPEDDEKKEDAAISAVRTAITLKEKMDEIIKSERERRLRRDIRGENEFYVGRTGHVGEFYSEREPAPQIRYRDVVGASFDLAKAHVEEVINLASFPHIVKASAPRGKIKSNVLLIGPYGCGKSEFARAVAGDRRVIGLYVSIADVLTAYMHESVKNVKRVWEEGKRLRQESRYTKPVALIQDEFDAWFQHGDFGFRHADEQQMERVLQEVLDGLVEYDGVFTIALTNRPGVIPDAILRRFKYVDVVGQLTDKERADLFKYFLTRGMPISTAVKSVDYARWAEMLKDSPGDVLGKIADEVHFKFIRGYRHANPTAARRLERYLTRIENERDLTRAEYAHVKRELAGYRRVTKPEVEDAIGYMLRQPAVQKMINSAREVYREADKIMQGLMEVGDVGPTLGFGVKERSRIWTPNR